MYIAKLGPRPWLEIAFSPACKSNCSDASNVVKTFIELGSSTFCSSCGRANLQQSPYPRHLLVRPHRGHPNVAKAQHFSVLVKVNYENQRKLTAEISKSAEKLMNLLKSRWRISQPQWCWALQLERRARSVKRSFSKLVSVWSIFIVTLTIYCEHLEKLFSAHKQPIAQDNLMLSVNLYQRLYIHYYNLYIPNSDLTTFTKG